MLEQKALEKVQTRNVLGIFPRINVTGGIFPGDFFQGVFFWRLFYRMFGKCFPGAYLLEPINEDRTIMFSFHMKIKTENNGMVQISAGGNIQNKSPYLTLKNSNLKSRIEIFVFLKIHAIPSSWVLTLEWNENVAILIYSLHYIFDILYKFWHFS